MRNIWISLLFVCAAQWAFAVSNTIDSLNHLLTQKIPDTTKVKILGLLVEEIHDDKIWPLYNKKMKALAEYHMEKSTGEERKVYQKAIASALNNDGFLLRRQGEIDEAIDLYEQALDIQMKINDEYGIISSLNNLGYAFVSKGEVDKGLEAYNRALEYLKVIDNKHQIADALNNMASVYEDQGDILMALDYFQQALSSYELENNQFGISATMNNIGMVQLGQKEFDSALDYFNKSLKIKTRIKDRSGEGIVYNNLGMLHELSGNPQMAISFYENALKVHRELKEQDKEANALRNIGLIQLERNIIREASKKLHKAKNLERQISNKSGMASTCAGLGILKIKTGETDSAIYYGLEAIKLSRELGYVKPAISASHVLAQAYALKRDTPNELKYFKYYVKLKDSISSAQKDKEIVRQQLKYEAEKRESLMMAENEKTLLIEKEKGKRKNIIIMFTVAGIGIALLLTFLLFKRLQLTKKQKGIIEEQKKQVHLQNMQLENQKDFLAKLVDKEEKARESAELSSAELMVKNKEITDSIRYAKRIQNAMLLPEIKISDSFPDHFVFHLPKDIVSGDFYWHKETKDYIYLAVADCTGHGVPGAFLTMLGITWLNEITGTKELSPSTILNELRDRAIRELSSDNKKSKDDQVRDGMDISLIRINKSNLEAQWSGANNPVYIIGTNELMGHELNVHSLKNSYSGGKERDHILYEIKGDRQPIGHFPNQQPFSEHSLQLSSKSRIYLFSDGFADQFGGPRGKKMKYNALKEILLDSEELDMHQQKDKLDQEFESWTSSDTSHYQQIDDVCIVGIKL